MRQSVLEQNIQLYLRVLASSDASIDRAYVGRLLESARDELLIATQIAPFDANGIPAPRASEPRVLLRSPNNGAADSYDYYSPIHRAHRPSGIKANGADCMHGDPPFNGTQSDRLQLFGCMVESWLETVPVPPLSILVADTRRSLRQVERCCKRLYGRSPKALSREVRAMRAAAAMSADPEAEYDVVQHGFYDQPHMIRELKHFTGKTPGQIRFPK